MISETEEEHHETIQTNLSDTRSPNALARNKLTRHISMLDRLDFQTKSSGYSTSEYEEVKVAKPKKPIGNQTKAYRCVREGRQHKSRASLSCEDLVESIMCHPPESIAQNDGRLCVSPRFIEILKIEQGNAPICIRSRTSPISQNRIGVQPNGFFVIAFFENEISVHAVHISSTNAGFILSHKGRQEHVLVLTKVVSVGFVVLNIIKHG